MDQRTDGKIPALDVPIALQRGEQYYYGPLYLARAPFRTKRVNYRGATLSIPIVKGIRYRVGSLEPSYERTTEMQEIDRGVVYITNKRIFFDGQLKNTTVTYKVMTSVILLDGGFQVEKQTGKSPCLKLESEPDKAGALATWALSAYHL
jgi:hypothetical protein